MSEKPIISLGSDAFERITSDSVAIKPFTMATEHGPIAVEYATGLTVLAIEGAGEQDRSAAIVLYRWKDGTTEGGEGFLHRMSAQTARAVATTLTRMANRIDPEGVN